MLEAFDIQQTIVSVHLRARLEEKSSHATEDAPTVLESVHRAEKLIAPVWPLSSFVARNPMMGLEDVSFDEAPLYARTWFSAELLPDEASAQAAFRRGEISLDALRPCALELLADAPVFPAIAATSQDASAYVWRRLIGQRGRALGADERAFVRQQIARLRLDLDVGPSASDELKHVPRLQLLDAVFSSGYEARLQQAVSKWCSAFFDEGVASIVLPGRSHGLFTAWRHAVVHDRSHCKTSRELLRTLSRDPAQVIEDSLRALRVPAHAREEYLKRHLGSMPGWAGYIKRVQTEGDGASHRVSLVQFLAVRLATELALLRDAMHDLGERHLEFASRPIEYLEKHAAPILEQARVRRWERTLESAWVSLCEHTSLPVDLLAGVTRESLLDLHRFEVWYANSFSRLAWLRAWEETYRAKLINTLDDSDTRDRADGSAPRSVASLRPNAQLVFCIDVRSEAFRRAIEAEGNYETFGFAGFFGIPLEVREYGAHESVASCPVILKPRHHIVEVAADPDAPEARAHLQNRKALQDSQALVHTLKHGVSSTFPMAEALGVVHGVSMLMKALRPASAKKLRERVYNWCVPFIRTKPCLGPNEHSAEGVPLELRVQYAAQALRTLGLTEKLAPVVVFAGHGSETTNNPFASKLDCGACGGRAGGLNAEVLAEICNDPEVRASLRNVGIEVPEDTCFLGAQHNTTRDALEWQTPTRHLSAVHASLLEQLARDLRVARMRVVKERQSALCSNSNAESPSKNAEAARGESVRSVPLRSRSSEPAEWAAARAHRPARHDREADRRAADWSEVRPEWGLARNASFIVGPRAWTRATNLQSRSFLQSYDWTQDADGSLLDTILGGPLAVAYWINTQYYFSTVAHAPFGSGNKVTQSIVGKVGVIQGNGSDLQTGLPRQSVFEDNGQAYHAPLRLLAVLHMPREHAQRSIERNPQLRKLLDHEWLALSVYDPTTRQWWKYTTHDTQTWKLQRSRKTSSGVWRRQSA